MTLLALLACFRSDPGDTSGDVHTGDSGGQSPADDSDGSGGEHAAVDFATVSIPLGRFPMGCDDAGCDPDEAPTHNVTVSAYVIDVYEVTVDQYGRCVGAGQCSAPYGEQGGPNAPVVGVTYTQAAQLCAWRGMSVPTEAEWERAARGDEGRTYPWGDDPPDCDHAASRACDGGLTDVGSHPAGASPFGTQDQAGNAWEWVSDAYDAAYYQDSPDTDPTGPTSGGLRTVRGMDLWSDATALRSSNRNYAIPTGVSELVGFRCAGSP